MSEVVEVSQVRSWTVHHYDSVGSTNSVARDFPAWHAVRADVQTAGRGRFQRRWISDAGGLWLSAVVPCRRQSSDSQLLPLAAGLAVFDALQSLKVPNLRMRWPNDLLAADRKLAGLLVDRFCDELAVVGIGINVCNEPEAGDAALARLTARLADVLATLPALSALCEVVLEQLRGVVMTMNAGGVSKLLAEMARLWGGPRCVELNMDGIVRRGIFNGVDDQGRLILSGDDGASDHLSAHQVTHLKEIS